MDDKKKRVRSIGMRKWVGVARKVDVGYDWFGIEFLADREGF